MPADVDYLRGLSIVPYDGDRHDRTTFTCGVERIDNFLKITASKYVEGDIGRIFVAVERDGGRLVGFYAVGPHAIDANELDASLKKRLPNYDRIASYYLSMIGVHADIQRKGLGGFLLADALKRCMHSADAIGGRFVVLDAISEDAAKLYARYDFIPLVSQPGRMVVSIAKLRANEAERVRRRGNAG